LGAEDASHRKSLKPRQIQMMAIGGAIGTVLFLGAGGRLAAIGPSLFLAYAICGDVFERLQPTAGAPISSSIGIW
jgi:L-asparagine permease